MPAPPSTATKPGRLGGSPSSSTKDFTSRIQNATARGATCVYAYLRDSDFSPYYIGVSTGHRRAICQSGHRKHGVSVPKDKTYVVVLRGRLTKFQAAAWEQFFIRHYGRIDLGTGILRNRSDGGEGMQNPSPETRSKISAFMRTRPVSEKQIAHIRAVGQRPKSKQTRLLMSLSQKGRVMSDTHRINHRKAVDQRVFRAAEAQGLSVEDYKALIKSNARQKERQRKALIRQQAAKMGMSKWGFDKWQADGCPADLTPYLKRIGPKVDRPEGLDHLQRRKAERNAMALSERQYRLWVKDGRPSNVDYYRTIYGKPGRRPKSLTMEIAA